MAKRINNHLRKGYSDYNLLFIKKYYSELNLQDRILDVGCGHFRNLRLFHELGFKKFNAIDKNKPEPISSNLKFKIKFKLDDIQKGLPYEDKSFDIVLCNYVLMFINSDKLKYVIDELLRVCNKFCIIETQKQYYTYNGEMKDYNFGDIISYIEYNKEFEIIDKKIYYEKLIIRRI